MQETRIQLFVSFRVARKFARAEGVGLPDERSEELCEAKSQEAERPFVSDDAAKPEGLLRRDGMGRVEDSRPIGVELRQIAVRRLVASAAFVVARQRPKRVSAKQTNNHSNNTNRKENKP